MTVGEGFLIAIMCLSAMGLYACIACEAAKWNTDLARRRKELDKARKELDEWEKDIERRQKECE